MKFARAIGRAAASFTLICRHAGHPSRRLARRIAADQKRIWVFPVTAAQGAAWKPALGVLGATAALIALDPLDTPCLQRARYQETPVVNAINRVLSAGNMARLIWAVPLAFYIGGFLLRNSYAWRSGLLALEAAGDAEIVAITMKHVDRRMRPIEVGADADFTRTWFRTKVFKLDGAGCFPSGHTASAFSVATVFAGRYPELAWAAYGMAGIIGASRVSTRAHFPSDVFFGAALGYSISHFVVMERVMTPNGHVTAGG
jgi:membrane-associated phospholipid phosphatase